MGFNSMFVFESTLKYGQCLFLFKLYALRVIVRGRALMTPFTFQLNTVLLNPLSATHAFITRTVMSGGLRAAGQTAVRAVFAEKRLPTRY